MKYLPYIIFSIPFLYFNYKIIQKDIKEKIIPNKYLLYLIGLLLVIFIYQFFSYDIVVNYITLLLQIFLSVFVSFLLYYFGIWGAGDAKYLLVLSLYVSHIGIIKFIGNISILILSYLLLYFLYFYFGKCLISLNYAKSLYNNIYIDLKDKFMTFIKHSDGNIYRKTSIIIILNWLLLFLFIFVSFRLTRLYIMEDLFHNNLTKNDFGTLFQHYYFIIIASTFSLFFIIRYTFRKLYNYIYHKLEDKYGIIFKYNKTNLFIPISLLSILIGFIVFEYIINPYEITKYLYRIFTFYIILFVIFRIIFYSYKLTFQISETYYIELDNLKKGELIDRKYLIDIFGEQKCLGNNNENGILYPNPKKFFMEISNPINEEDINKLKEIYNIVYNYHTENKTQNYEKNNNIKVLKTFPFAPYILGGFLLTIFFQGIIFKFINNSLLEVIKSIYGTTN